jgi:hypothetical protein
MGVVMRGYNLGQVLPCQASVLQQGVNFVRFNLEAFVARGFFAQVANQKVGESCLVPLGVVDEKACLCSLSRRALMASASALLAAYRVCSGRDAILTRIA